MSRSLPLAMALGSLVLIGTGSAFAQGSESVQAQIPFDFKVGRVTLPAGQYGLKYEPAEAQGVLAVRSEDGRHGVFVLTEPVSAGRGTPNANRLVFEQVGTTYILSEVFTDDSSVGLEVLGTHPAD